MLQRYDFSPTLQLIWDRLQILGTFSQTFAENLLKKYFEIGCVENKFVSNNKLNYLKTNY